MNEWIEFYDSAHSIYADKTHRDAHFRGIASHIACYLPNSDAVVMDYSCGEALGAAIVAEKCARLILVEPAKGVRARLQNRFADNPKISVMAPEAIAALMDGTIDLIVMISVSQYLAPDALDATLANFRRWLKAGGHLVIGDVVPPHIGIASDALALLRFGWREGFFIAALASLIRTAFSDYRKLRQTLRITRYDEATMIAHLEGAGFAARRAAINTGHNRARMTFIATPLP